MPGKARREGTSPPPNCSMKLTSSLRSDCATLRPNAALLRLRRNAPWGCSLSRAHQAEFFKEWVSAQQRSTSAIIKAYTKGMRK